MSYTNLKEHKDSIKGSQIWWSFCDIKPMIYVFIPGAYCKADWKCSKFLRSITTFPNLIRIKIGLKCSKLVASENDISGEIGLEVCSLKQL